MKTAKKHMSHLIAVHDLYDLTKFKKLKTKNNLPSQSHEVYKLVEHKRSKKNMFNLIIFSNDL